MEYKYTKSKGCGRATGHGDICEEDYLCGSCSKENEYIDRLVELNIDRLVELQQYIFVATMADCFVDLKPEHRLYESIRQDLKAALRALKMPAQEEKK